MHPTSALPDSSYSGFTPTYIHTSVYECFAVLESHPNVSNPQGTTAISDKVSPINSVREEGRCFSLVTGAEVGCALGDAAGF